MSANTNKRLMAIVTGASSGVGLGITRALLERGYRVVANSRTISQSRELIPAANLVLVDGDIGKKETAVKVVDAALLHFDRIDLLVNNAGIYMPKPFTEYTPMSKANDALDRLRSGKARYRIVLANDI